MSHNERLPPNEGGQTPLGIDPHDDPDYKPAGPPPPKTQPGRMPDGTPLPNKPVFSPVRRGVDDVAPEVETSLGSPEAKAAVAGIDIPELPEPTLEDALAELGWKLELDDEVLIVVVPSGKKLVALSTPGEELALTPLLLPGKQRGQTVNVESTSFVRPIGRYEAVVAPRPPVFTPTPAPMPAVKPDTLAKAPGETTLQLATKALKAAAVEAIAGGRTRDIADAQVLLNMVRNLALIAAEGVGDVDVVGAGFDVPIGVGGHAARAPEADLANVMREMMMTFAGPQAEQMRINAAREKRHEMAAMLDEIRDINEMLQTQTLTDTMTSMLRDRIEAVRKKLKEAYDDDALVSAELLRGHQAGGAGPGDGGPVGGPVTD